MLRRNTMIADKTLIEDLKGLPANHPLKIKGSIVVIEGDDIKMKKLEEIEEGDIIDLSAVNSPSKLINKYLASKDTDDTTLREYLSKEDMSILVDLLNQKNTLSQQAQDTTKREIAELKSKLKNFNDEKETEDNDLILLVKKQFLKH